MSFIRQQESKYSYPFELVFMFVDLLLELFQSEIEIGIIKLCISAMRHFEEGHVVA